MTFPLWSYKLKLTAVKHSRALALDDAKRTIQALEIAWEALEKIERYGRPLEAPQASYAVCEINDHAENAMRKIEELGK